MDRRTFVNRLLVAGGLGSTSAVTFNSTFAAGSNFSGYKALISIHLNGGCDGNDVIVPTDSAYADYAKSRPNVALKKDTLTPLSGALLPTIPRRLLYPESELERNKNTPKGVLLTDKLWWDK